MKLSATMRSLIRDSWLYMAVAGLTLTAAASGAILTWRPHWVDWTGLFAKPAAHAGKRDEKHEPD
jgi:hypothetical protein